MMEIHELPKPGECCTESFIVTGAFSTQKELCHTKHICLQKLFAFFYYKRWFRKDVTKQNFQFVPDLGKYEGVYTDEMLCKRWSITKEEWAFMNSRIKSSKWNKPSQNNNDEEKNKRNCLYRKYDTSNGKCLNYDFYD